jgi:catechol 2,3-dioxygenase-like lactoylglutathione lyase family enzyme
VAAGRLTGGRAERRRGAAAAGSSRISFDPEEAAMACHVHHAHLFASDIDRTIRYFREFFGGRVVLDANLAGARNVFLEVGKGRLHLYDQPPKKPGSGTVHHLGIQTDDIDGIVENLRTAGVRLRKDVTDLGFWKYVMVPAPDELLIELFQVDKSALPEELADFFA